MRFFIAGQNTCHEKQPQSAGFETNFHGNVPLEKVVVMQVSKGNVMSCHVRSLSLFLFYCYKKNKDPGKKKIFSLSLAQTKLSLFFLFE